MTTDLKDKIEIAELKEMAKKMQYDLVKAMVDIDKEIISYVHRNTKVVIPFRTETFSLKFCSSGSHLNFVVTFPFKKIFFAFGKSCI